MFQYRIIQIYECFTISRPHISVLVATLSLLCVVVVLRIFLSYNCIRCDTYLQRWFVLADIIKQISLNFTNFEQTLYTVTLTHSETILLHV